MDFNKKTFWPGKHSYYVYNLEGKKKMLFSLWQMSTLHKNWLWKEFQTLVRLTQDVPIFKFIFTFRVKKPHVT